MSDGSVVHLDVPGVATHGYAIAPNVFIPSEIDSLCFALADPSLPRSRAGIRHVLRHPAVERIANDPRLIDVARDILGPNAVPFHATLFDKSPDANWLVVWHQDTALPLKERHETRSWGPWSVKDGVTYAHAPASALEHVLAIRIHLDDSTDTNGPLRVLPGTHDRGVLTDDQIEELSKATAPVSCTVSRGGLVLMRPLLIHASSKSTSSQSRRVLHIEYAAKLRFGELELAYA